MSRSTLNTTINTKLATGSDITATELREVHMAQADYGDEQDALKVDKVTGKSLVSDTEITKLATVAANAQPNAANTVTDANYVHTDSNYTAAEKTKVGAISGTNTGDETATSIKSKLGIATISGSNTGDQDISGIVANASAIGTLTSLNTSTKANLVAALNEVKAVADTAAGGGTVVGDGTVTNVKLASDVKIGSLAGLNTTAKGSVIAAVNEVKTTADAKTTNITDTASAALMDSKDATVLASAATAAASANKAASTITGTKTSAFISDFNTAVDARIPAGNGQPDLNIINAGLSTGSANNSPTLQALIGSGKTIYVKQGTYTFTQQLLFNNVSNLRVVGETGTKFNFSGDTSVTAFWKHTLLKLQGAISNITFENISFENIGTEAGVPSGETFWLSMIHTASGTQIDGMKIKGCSFKCPNIDQNAIGLYPANSTGAFVKNFYMSDTKFNSLGRMGIEIYDADLVGLATNAQNIYIDNNYFSQLGLKGNYGQAVSAFFNTGSVSNNTIKDVKASFALEISYCQNTTVIGNKLTSTVYSFNPFSLEGNVGMVVSNNTVYNPFHTTHDKDLYITKGNDITFIGNKLNFDGRVYCEQLTNSLIADNTIITTNPNAIALVLASANNRIIGNTLDNTAAANNDGLIYYSGSGTTGNTVAGNTFKMQGGVGGYIVQGTGATGNALSQHSRIRTISTDGTDILPTDEFLIVSVSGNQYLPDPGNYYGAIEQELYIKNTSAGTVTINDHLAAGQKTVLQSQEGVLFKNNGTSYYAFTQTSSSTFTEDATHRTVTDTQITTWNAKTTNSTDAALRDRSTHTGTQAASTITGTKTAAFISDFNTAAAAAAPGIDFPSTDFDVTTPGGLQTVNLKVSRIQEIAGTGTSSYKAPTPLIRSQQTSGLLPSVPLPSVINVSGTAVNSAFPDILIDKRGRMQSYYSYGSAHASFDHLVKRSVSSNGGATWITNTVTTPLVNCEEVNVRQLSNGKIGMITASSDASGHYKVYFSTSDDDGETWGTFTAISDTYPTTIFGSFSNDLFEHKGVLYVTYYTATSNVSQESTFLIKSTDMGATWGSPITIGVGGSHDYNEARLAVWRDVLVMYIRDDAFAKLWRTTSTDGFATHTTLVDVTPSGWVACRPDVLFVGDMVHMLYRGPSQTMLRVTSYDGGITWSTNETVETGANIGYVYSRSIYDDGLIISVYAMERDFSNHADVRILTWRYGTAIGLDGTIATDITPAAPTSPVTDDTANTFDWTHPSGCTTTDEEITVDFGATYSAASKPLSVGNIAKSIGQVGVRVKAIPGRKVSATLFNTTAFTLSGASFDTDAQAFFTAAGIANTTQQNAVNQLVLDWKTAGIWTKITFSHLNVGGTATTHKYNIKDPQDTDGAYRNTYGGSGITHNSAGISWGGAASANTHLIPANTYNSNCFMSFYRAGGTAGIDFGTFEDAAGAVSFYFYNIGGSIGGRWGWGQTEGAEITVTGQGNSGIFAATKNGTAVAAYKNGTSVGTATRTSTSVAATIPLVEGALNDDSTIDSFSNATGACVYTFGTYLTPTEVAAYSTAVQTFLTALSR